MPAQSLSLADAIALLRPTDTLALGFGPAEPTPFLEVLAARDDFARLLVYGGLLTQPFEVFTKPGVQLRSAFLGGAERALRAAGHDVQFVPCDFRRFAKALRRVNPRVLVTAHRDFAAMSPVGWHAAENLDRATLVAPDPTPYLCRHAHDRAFSGRPATCGRSRPRGSAPWNPAKGGALRTLSLFGCGRGRKGHGRTREHGRPPPTSKQGGFQRLGLWWGVQGGKAPLVCLAACCQSA